MIASLISAFYKSVGLPKEFQTPKVLNTLQDQAPKLKSSQQLNCKPYYFETALGLLVPKVIP